MHVAGSQNTAADFLSRLELTPKKSSAQATGRHYNGTHRNQPTVHRRC